MIEEAANTGITMDNIDDSWKQSSWCSYSQVARTLSQVLSNDGARWPSKGITRHSNYKHAMIITDQRVNVMYSNIEHRFKWLDYSMLYLRHLIFSICDHRRHSKVRGEIIAIVIIAVLRLFRLPLSGSHDILLSFQHKKNIVLILRNLKVG